MATEEPDPKKIKTGLEDLSAILAAKKAEEPVEEEEDAPKSSAKKISGVSFHVPDTTVNVMKGEVGGLLKSLSDGGFQYLLAGARASAGIKSGRYMFESRIIENVHPADGHGSKGPTPKQLLRVGVSTSSSCLILGQTENNMCFESDGHIMHNKRRTPGGARFGRDVVAAVVLNLDSHSKNFQTLSLFLDGVRATQPQPLPDSMKGKALFPHVTYKNVTLHMNWGPPSHSLPFKCLCMQELEVKDSEVTPVPAPLADGKSEVLFPVCLPDEGSFDWLDSFLETNPQFVEISDRMIADWAEKSDVWGLQKKNWKSMDKPEICYNLPGLDDASVRKVLNAVIPLQPRHLVVMEVKSNLLKEERAATLEKFPSAAFTRIARVIMGDPSPDFKKFTHSKIIDEKQDVVNIEFTKKKLEEQRKQMVAKRQREVERQKKKIDKQRKTAEKEMKKKLEEAQKAQEAEHKPAEEIEQKKTDEDTEMPEKKEVEAKEPEPEESEDEEEAEEPDETDDKEEAPRAELTPEEKKINFRQKMINDLTSHALSANFTKFSLPEKDEGFDDIKYDWSKRTKCLEYVKAWVLDKKNTTRIEDLKPSEWFNAEWARWQKTMQLWHSKQNEHRAVIAKREADRVAKAAKKATAKALADRKKVAEEAAKQQAEEAAKQKAVEDDEQKASEDKEGEEQGEAEKDNKAVDADKDNKEGGPPDMAVEKKEEKEAEVEEEECEDEDMSNAVDFDGVDIFGIEEVSDIGDGSPLFKMFGFEDWALLGLRFELHLLSHAFTKDADDPDRKGVHLDHLGFYYQKYFKKTLNLKFFGLETNADLVNLVEDSIRLRGSVIESRLPESLESLGIFVKITEESRRDRTRLIDLGDESAKLKIQSGLQSSLAPLGKGGFVQPVLGKGISQTVGVMPGKSGLGKVGCGGPWGAWNNKGGNPLQSFSGARPAPYSFGAKKGGGGKTYGKSWSKWSK